VYFHEIEIRIVNFENFGLFWLLFGVLGLFWRPDFEVLKV